MDSEDIRKAGLKVTSPRVKILELFSNSEQNHLSADDVYKLLLDSSEEVGVATVYRVLTQFEDAGILKRHNFEGDHAVYELNHGDHHDHLICIKCGRVEEFMDPVIEAKQDDIARKAKFEIVDHALTIYGICKACS